MALVSAVGNANATLPMPSTPVEMNIEVITPIQASTSPVVERYTQKRIDGLLRYYSSKYAVSYQEMKQVMIDESNGDIYAKGKAGEIGLFQFKPATFNRFEKLLGEDLSIKNPEHQIKLACWCFAHGYSPHWTTFIKNKSF